MPTKEEYRDKLIDTIGKVTELEVDVRVRTRDQHGNVVGASAREKYCIRIGAADEALKVRHEQEYGAGPTWLNRNKRKRDEVLKKVMKFVNDYFTPVVREN